MQPDTLSPLTAAASLLDPLYNSQVQWEVLVILGDWVCINVPGDGLAWVSTHSVTATTARSSSVRINDVAAVWIEICSRIGIEAKLWVKAHTKTKAQVMGQLLTQLDVSSFTTEDLDALLKNCPRITQLDAHG